MNIDLFSFFAITVSKFLVTTGTNTDGFQTTSKIVDLTVKGGNMCSNWPKFPQGVYAATGGLIGDTVIICGGWDGSWVDECYSLTSKKAKLVTHMSVGRTYASSIVINDNTLWVTGGWGGDASTEHVKTSGTMPGPDLPIALSKHAMVAINSSCSMVIGGDPSYTGLTFFYDHNEGEWINGPSLMQARGYHAAGIVTDEVTDEHFVAVTGGYDGDDNLDSTEILQDGNWVQGIIYDIRYMLSFEKNLAPK